MAKRGVKKGVRLSIVGRGFGREKTLLIAVPLVADVQCPDGLSVQRVKGGYEVSLRGAYGENRFGIATLTIAKGGAVIDFAAGAVAPGPPAETSATAAAGDPYGMIGAHGGILPAGSIASGNDSGREATGTFDPPLDSRALGDAELLDRHAEASHRELTVVPDEEPQQ